MIVLNELKAEAKMLLDEVNGNFERPQNSSNSLNCYLNSNPENVTFKERVRTLRRKIQVLQSNKTTRPI